jgi:long-chain fatty acid transport protein
MNMKKQRNEGVSKILTILMLGAMAHGAYADGYRNPPPTAEGIAKSGANMVFVDDASAVSYNPANLAFQTKVSIVVDATLAQSETTFDSSSPSAVPGKAVSDDPWQVLPNLFVSVPIGDSGVVAGLGITTPFGQSIKYNKADLFDPAYISPTSVAQPIYEAEIGLVNFNPSIAFKVGDSIAIGVGADIYYSSLKFKQDYTFSAIPPGGLPNQEAEADADGYGFGGNAAITWKVTDKQNLALSYRSEVKVEYEGDLTATPSAVAVPPQLVNSSFDMDIKYPTVIGAGYGVSLSDTIRVEANLEWLEWSVNDTQTADLGANGTQSAPQDWDNTFTVGVGGDWQFAGGWVARAGYAFIESPIPDETIAPILPDADRHVLSLGLGYTFKGHTFDLAYAYSIYDDRNNTGNPAATYQGSYDIDSNLVGLTYSFSF